MGAEGAVHKALWDGTHLVLSGWVCTQGRHGVKHAEQAVPLFPVPAPPADALRHAKLAPEREQHTEDGVFNAGTPLRVQVVTPITTLAGFAHFKPALTEGGYKGNMEVRIAEGDTKPRHIRSTRIGHVTTTTASHGLDVAGNASGRVGYHYLQALAEIRLMLRRRAPNLACWMSDGHFATWGFFGRTSRRSMHSGHSCCRQPCSQEARKVVVRRC